MEFEDPLETCDALTESVLGMRLQRKWFVGVLVGLSRTQKRRISQRCASSEIGTFPPFLATFADNPANRPLTGSRKDSVVDSFGSPNMRSSRRLSGDSQMGADGSEWQ